MSQYLIKTEQNEILADTVHYCHNIQTRLIGLLGTRTLGPKEACWLTPCFWIHTFGMRYPLDVYFLNKKNEVIAISRNLLPNRISAPFFRASSVVEMATNPEVKCRVGSRLLLEKKPKGQATSEFIIAFVLLGAIMLALADMVAVGYTWSSLHYSIAEAARYASVGRSMDEVKANARQTAGKLGIRLTNGDITLRNTQGNELTAIPSDKYFLLRARSQVKLTPLSAFMGYLMGNRAGTMDVWTETVIKGEPFQ